MNTETVSQRAEVNRRNFCTSVLLATGALVIGANRVEVEAAQHSGVQLAYPPMKIAGAESLMPGTSLYFSYPTPKDAALLVRGPEGEYYAYSRKCAHLGCAVEYSDARRCISCPCHLGTYDARSGAVLFGPPRRPLDAIILQMRAGGEVWAVGKVIGNDDRNA